MTDTGNSRNSHRRIRPWPENPRYWAYKGRPILLLGGSIEDNLFQRPDIETQLDRLQSVGGNYVRCTMSSRDPGDIWPFERDPTTGLYDLNRPGMEYWSRFERFLQLTAEREIIVQIELWDRFDFARDPWQDNPYNPKNNVNYTVQESGLLEHIDSHPGQRESCFFRTVPALENNERLLAFQLTNIDKQLSISLPYGHVLYCMDNETNESPEWPWYWAHYLHKKADEAGVSVQLTEMWDAHDILDDEHLATVERTDLFSFVDVSQNNHQPAREHWERLLAFRAERIETDPLRPINCVKIYGANSGNYGSTRDAQERFWRIIFAGLAGCRFHRPPSGLGLGSIAQAHIRSMRMFTDAFDPFSFQPHNELLHNRSWNEAYCMANPVTDSYAIFFPDGGDVLLDLSTTVQASFILRWLDIRQGLWQDVEERMTDADGFLHVQTPAEEGYWALLVTTDS